MMVPLVQSSRAERRHTRPVPRGDGDACGVEPHAPRPCGAARARPGARPADVSRAACVVPVALAGCAGLEPATPPDYTGPTVNVADQAVQVSGKLLHVFELTQVDGRRLATTSMATVRANQGRGFSVAPVALSNELPVRPARVQLLAATQYAAPILAMTNPTCRVQGEVAFTPEPGKAYRVAGRIAAEACEVWIEDVATKQPVTTKVSGKGSGS